MTEQLEKIKRMHDIIKSDPFWITFDLSLYHDILISFKDLNNIIYGSADKTNPYYAMWLCINHDFMAMWCIEDSKLRHGYEGKIPSNVILVFQTFLTLVHGLFEDRYCDEFTVYTCSYKNGEYHLATYRSLYDEDTKEYYVVGLVEEKQRESLIKACKALQEKARVEESKKWYDIALKELYTGEKLIQKCWLFKD